ncbi:hypothetical protein ACLF8M_07545 [Helicobacter pylori]
MWNERFLKIIPAIAFLFCILEVFELALIVYDMNKTEKLEAEVQNSLQKLEDITILINKHLRGMQQLENMRIKIK